MKIQKKDIKKLSIKEAVRVHNMVANRMDRLAIALSRSLPRKLREKYGKFETAFNIVWRGGDSFEILRGVNYNELSMNERRKMCREGRVKIAPVIRAWNKLGVRLVKVYWLGITTEEASLYAYFRIR